MKTKLKNLEVTKVDAVDEGANPEADIKLFKKKGEINNGNQSAQEGDQTETLIKRITKAVTDLFKTGVVEKKDEAESFGEKMDEVKRRKIVDEMWDLCYALHSSLVSIMNDDEIEALSAGEMMRQSIEEFSEYISAAVDKWSTGNTAGVVQKSIDNVTEGDVLHMEYISSRLDGFIQKAKIQLEKSKGDLEEMIKIDKSKMSPVEVAAYEEIVKKYGVDVDEQQTGVGKKKVDPEGNEDEIEEEETEKGGKKKCAKAATASVQEEGAGDIYKGLHPAVKAEMESLKKFREDAENKELNEIAKKYELIGKKPEDLVPMLKSLKAAGGTAYNDMLGVLDSAMAMAETSGTFNEIGKSSHNHSAIAKSATEAKVETIAKGYLEKDPEMSYVDAIAKAWENNPELMTAYEEEAGF